MTTVNQRLSDEMIAHALNVGRYSNGVVRKIAATLHEADAELSLRLAIALESLDASSFTVKRLEGLLASVRALNRQTVDTAMLTLTQELQQFAAYEVRFQYQLLMVLIPDEVLTHAPLYLVSPEQAYAAAMAKPFQGSLLAEHMETFSEDRMRRLVNTVRDGYLASDTTEQIVRRWCGTEAKHYQDGAQEITHRNAASIVKTAINHTAAVARTEFASKNADIIKGKVWLSTLDTRTTPLCRIRDGCRYTLDDKPIGHTIPYLAGPGRIHWCCRSTETFITPSWRELGIDSDEMSPATRASMDGQVSATTYGEWLQRQPYDRLVAIVGEKRARLMRDGGMRFDEFYSDKGEWLTLAQLKALDEQVFN